MQLLTHTPINRETWLNTITTRFIRPHFASKGFTIPTNIRLSCSLATNGIHTKSHQKRFALGVCFDPARSGDGNFEIVISPRLADSARVIDVLIHELCHATVGNEAGHKGEFARCAIAVGLTGKMTSTVASDALLATINQWLADMPAYPHAELNLSYQKQTTRNLACKCLKCGYALRTSSKWLKLAIPKCPLGHGKMWADFTPEDSEDFEG